MHAAEYTHFTAAYATRHLLKPTILSCSVTELLPHRPRTPRLYWFVVGTLQRVLPDHYPSPALLPHISRTPRRHRLAIGALRHTLVRPPAALHRIVLQARFQDQPTMRPLHTFAEHHLRIGVSATSRNRGICSQSIIALRSHLPFCLAVPPPNHAS